MSAFCKSCGHDDGCAHEPGPGTSIESIIRDYTVGAKRDCYVGGRKIELAERARAELDALCERAERAEKERDDITAEVERLRRTQVLWDAFVSIRDERDAALAKLSRYEATGPALLTIGDVQRIKASRQDYAERDLAFIVGCDAAQEQYARCVAIVERIVASTEANNQLSWMGARACLTALKDDAK